MSEALLPIVQTVNSCLSDYILFFMLIGVGLFYSIKTRFVQVRYFKEGVSHVFGALTLNGKKHDSGMSPFQAPAAAIAAQVGTGNIVGASGAILTGGPGAIFWMWIIAFFGMATIYAEATLAQETRIVQKDGNIKGGPVYYITAAFKGSFGKFLAGGYTGSARETVDKANLAQTAFGTVFGEQLGAQFVAVTLFFFAFSTILSRNLFRKINVAYLFGEKSTKLYTVIALMFIFLGTLASNGLVWELSDMFNNLMVIPNALALFALGGMVVAAMKHANKLK